MRRVTVAVWAVALAAALAAAGKINHIVVLMEENRSFDHMLGLFNGTQHGTRGKDLYNDVSYTLKNGTRVTKRVPWSGTAPYVNYCDPDHSFRRRPTRSSATSTRQRTRLRTWQASRSSSSTGTARSSGWRSAT